MGTLGEPHLRIHTPQSSLGGEGGGGLKFKLGKERRRDPLVCSWMLYRCGQRRVVILQM